MKSEKKVLVIIDTSNNKEVVVGLIIDGKEDIRKKVLDTYKAQVVLPLLHELLQGHSLNIHDVTAIKVNPGPGSFTGVRVGLTIANTLGKLLQVPVNNQPIGEQARATYE